MNQDNTKFELGLGNDEIQCYILPLLSLLTIESV